MQWMIANMWMALAAATVLGLLFGFSFRGLLASNRVRRALVEREIAKTELTQAKAEVDALYAAQRKRKEEGAQAVGGDDTLRAELDERENRISALGEELTAARAELERLQSDASREDGGLVENVGAAALGAVAGAVLSDDNEQELTELRDRNTWLEERVAALEADVSAAALVAAPSDAPEESGLVVDKLNWQTAYLRQRVEALEAKILAQKPETPDVSEVEETPAPVLAPVPVVEDEGARKAADEELARLRWRNRYLEGRLAYFEESGEDEAETEATDSDPEPEVSLIADPVAESEADPETEPEDVSEADPADASEAEQESEEEREADPAEATAEEDVEVEATEEADAEDATDADGADQAAEPEAAAATETVHPSEAMLAELEGEQPAQVEKPDGGGDDLTAIAGIGPRIAEVLNGLGIWTYAQVAEWTPANETWIENHLAFKGRVGREKWVEQASALMAAA